MPLSGILRLALKQHDLTWHVRDGVILITTPEELEQHGLELQVYPVEDLVTPVGALSILSGDGEDNCDFDSLIDVIVASIAPQGAIVLIESQAPIDARQLMPKSVSLHWELMFTRPIFGTPDMIEQHHLLNAVADMVDHGRIRHTMTLNLGPMTAARLREAHAKVESGTMIGKVVLEGL